MFPVWSRFLCITLALSLAFTPVIQAQQAVPGGAPVPPQIAEAHTVFVSNGGGSNYFDMFTGGPDRAYNTFYGDLQRAGHYQLVSAPAQADLIFEVKSIAPTVGVGDDVGPNPQVVLSIVDPKTQAVLWTTRANVRAIGTKGRRDRQFDQSVDVLVDKLGQITGQPLSPAQAKAVRDNSRWPTAAKVFLVVGIAAAVALTTYGIYRVTHPPTLPQPTLPGFPAAR
jgi:hypothetical protein